MFKSLIFLVFLSLVSSHWICNLEGGESCVTSPGDEIITEGFEGAWISHKTQVTVSNEINCAFACDRINCAFYIYPEEFKCILGLPKVLKVPAKFGSARHCNLDKLTNVALLKPTNVSSVHYVETITKENAVDGIIGDGAVGMFATDPNDLNGWLVVDLQSEHVIRAIRIFERTDVIIDLVGSTIYGGNELILDGNFDGKYTVLSIIEEKRPTVYSQYVVSFVNKKTYRYVAMKKNLIPGHFHLMEFEVFA